MGSLEKNMKKTIRNKEKKKDQRLAWLKGKWKNMRKCVESQEIVGNQGIEERLEI